MEMDLSQLDFFKSDGLLNSEESGLDAKKLINSLTLCDKKIT